MRNRLSTIYNGYDPEAAPSARPLPAREHKLIVHAGTIYHGRNPDLLMEGLARLRARGVPEALGVKVLLLGPTLKLAEANWALYGRAEQQGWLQLQETVPRPEAQKIVEQADALLIVQPHTTVQIPGKLFEYICVGRPVMAIVPRSSPIEMILQKSELPHVCLYPDDPPEAADEKIVRFLRLPSTPTPINNWFRTNFSGEVQAEALARIVGEAAGKAHM